MNTFFATHRDNRVYSSRNVITSIIDTSILHNYLIVVGKLPMIKVLVRLAVSDTAENIKYSVWIQMCTDIPSMNRDTQNGLR